MGDGGLPGKGMAGWQRSRGGSIGEKGDRCTTLDNKKKVVKKKSCLTMHRVIIMSSNKFVWKYVLSCKEFINMYLLNNYKV